MKPWVAQQFGSVAAVESQEVVRVVNRVTGEGALFNSLRSQRPIQTEEAASVVAAMSEDVLADPWQGTPEDTFGRIANEHGVTAANVAKYDRLHSLVVFAEPAPLAFTRESLAGHLDLARQWMERAYHSDSSAMYPYVLWNCLWQAGGSLIHGHLQVAMARDMHYVKIERLRHDAENYRREHDVNYFDDLLATHHSLGLSHKVGGSHLLAHLTPARDKEVLVFAQGFSEAVDGVFHVLRVFRDMLGVRSFNMGVLMPPLAPAQESWDGFPVIFRLVDRGSLESRTSDVGGMELFAESVVSSDPFAIAQALRESREGAGA